MNKLEELKHELWLLEMKDRFTSKDWNKKHELEQQIKELEDKNNG